MGQGEPGPTCIAHYAIQGTLGEGATAIVYLAEHRATGRRVAIKTLRPGVAQDVVARARLQLEARALGRVHGPSIVDALDAGVRDDGTPYVVLERLDGVSVAMHLAAGPLPIAASIAIADAVLEALERLHTAGFVHRDVKSANVVLHREAGRLVPKLIDLGACIESEELVSRPRLTTAGLWVGTPSYVPPEQLTGARVDVRADVYGVGALLFECVTGQPPHAGASVAEALFHAASEPVPKVRTLRADCPPRLEALIARAVDADPRVRPASARAMRMALEAIRVHAGLDRGAEALTVLEDPRALARDAGRGRHRQRPRMIAGVVVGVVATLAAAAAIVLAVVEHRPVPAGPVAVPTEPVPAATWARTVTVLREPEPMDDAVVAPAPSPAATAPSTRSAEPTAPIPPAPTSAATTRAVPVPRRRTPGRAARAEPVEERSVAGLGGVVADPEPAPPPSAPAAGSDAPAALMPELDGRWVVEEPGAGVATPPGWDEPEPPSDPEMRAPEPTEAPAPEPSAPPSSPGAEAEAPVG